MKFKKIMIFGLLVTSQFGVAIGEINKKTTITEILAAVTAYCNESLDENYSTSEDLVVVLGNRDEFKELSKRVIGNLRKFSDQDTSLNKICLDRQAHDIEHIMSMSQRSSNGIKNNIESCVDSIFFTKYKNHESIFGYDIKENDPEHKRTIRQLLSGYDACVKKHSKNSPSYHNHSYAKSHGRELIESDARDLQAKKDFDMARLVHKVRKEFNQEEIGFSNKTISFSNSAIEPKILP